jgi:hypothetical protein
MSDLLYLISFLRKNVDNYFNVLPNELLDYFIVPMTRWKCIGPNLGKDILWENWVINPGCFTLGDVSHVYVYNVDINNIYKIRYSSNRRIIGDERVTWTKYVHPGVIGLDFDENKLKVIYNNYTKYYCPDGEFKYISYENNIIAEDFPPDSHNQRLVFRDGMLNLLNHNNKMMWRDVIIARRMKRYQIDDAGNIFLLMWSNEDTIGQSVKKKVLYGFETWSSFINDKKIQYNIGQYL